MHAELENIKQQLLALLDKINTFAMTQNREKLYLTAKEFLGRDASPDDVANDRFACAESVSKVIQATFPGMRFPLILSTNAMLNYFNKSPSFRSITSPSAGDIIISATGTGNGNLANGHVGIVGKNQSPDGTPYILSNDSRTGTWEAAFTLGSWKRFYAGKGGFPVLFFEIV